MIVLRERYFDDMKADGWLETEAEALAPVQQKTLGKEKGHK